MRPLGTDDGWQYTNEGSHLIPEWQNRFWNGVEGYQRLLAVKDQVRMSYLYQRLPNKIVHNHKIVFDILRTCLNIIKIMSM